jgi:hypothetical protein
MNIINIAFILCLIAPLFFFGEMASWQRIGYICGVVVWLANSLLIGSMILGVIAFFMLLVSSIQILVEHFPIRL